MIQIISKNEEITDLNLASRYKDYSLNTIFPNYAYDCIKIWINDDDKFNELKNLLTFKIDKSLTNIQIIPENNKFTISANNLHNLLFGFGYYVREIAHGHIGWCVERVPSEWIIPTNTITINPNFKYRMAYNYCTLSYTMAFWDETLWEREIIRLAMLGFNMALVIAGMPKIWQLVLNELNQTDELIREFIPDEAAQAWWAMGNLQQNDGTLLSDDRIDKDAALARFIVKKMRMVGIEPVFQSFTGLVPDDLALDTNEYYDAAYVRQGKWCGYICPKLLIQTTDTFSKIAKIWYKHLKAVYDTNVISYLGGDIFHEGGNAGKIVVEDAAKAIQREQQLACPGAKWLLQCWQASDAQRRVFRSVNQDLALLQVLNCDMGYNWNKYTNAGFYVNNQQMPFIFCEVLNFGGNTGFYGGYKMLTELSSKTVFNGYERLEGLGLLSEGLETNQIFYDGYVRFLYADLVNQTDNLKNETNLIDYVNNYTYSRYGLSTENLTNATITLLSTLQNSNREVMQQGTNECLYCAIPGTNKLYVYQYSTNKLAVEDKDLYYVTNNTIDVLSAMNNVANENTQLWNEETFRFDICDVARQVIADSSYDLLFNKSFYDNATKSQVLNNIMLMDDLLQTVKDWRLDYKESRTTTKAGDDGKKAYRRMITSWGKPGSDADDSLHDYAHRQYAGLMKYYYDRWDAYFNNNITNFSSITDNFLISTYTDLGLSAYNEVSSLLPNKVENILTIFNKKESN